ncbi:MAG: PAS domain-containing protein, partial [Candidatus Bipolaricaulis sp.]|nr:PAS domain-containing protein [Candidatus Bipolaricaulis sp.]
MPERKAHKAPNADLFRELFDRVPIGLYRTTPGGKVVDVNPAFVEMLGYPDRETLLGEAADTVYARREARDRWRAEMAEKGTVSGFEAEWLRHDGTPIWVEENAHAVRDADGRILHYEGSAQDVTARRRAQAQLAEEKARFEQLFAASPEAIVLCSNQGRVLRANDAFFTLFGYLPEEAVGRDVDRLVAPERDALHFEARGITEQIADGQLSFVETQRPRKDGRLIHVSILGKPIPIGHHPIA